MSRISSFHVVKPVFASSDRIPLLSIPAARSHGVPSVRTASVCSPMSLGSETAQRWNRAKISGRPSL